MKFTKLKAYFLFIGLGITCGLLFQAVWLLSDVADGEILEFGRGPGRKFKAISSVTLQYTVRGSLYNETYLRSGLPDDVEIVPVRYLIFAPSISRLNTPTGNWGLISAIYLVYFLSVSIVFLKKDIIPHRSHFLLLRKKPFIQLKVDNLTD